MHYTSANANDVDLGMPSVYGPPLLKKSEDALHLKKHPGKTKGVKLYKKAIGRSTHDLDFSSMQLVRIKELETKVHSSSLGTR